MTKIEQAKVAALIKCRMANFHGERSFVKGLAWLVEHSPATNLSPHQKWYLDVLLWRYRKQLAGREAGFEMPTDMPSKTDYEPRRREPAQRALL